MRSYAYPSLLILIIVFAAACGSATPTPMPTKVATDVPTATTRPTKTPRPPTKTPRPTNTPTPTPTPLPAEIDLSIKSIEEDGVIIIDRVSVPDRSWLAIYSGETYLDAVQVKTGTTKDIEFVVDPFSIGNDISVSLYEIDGDLFDPNTALIIEENNQPVTITTTVEIAMDMPEFIATDQRIGADGILLIDTITADRPGWLAIYRDEDNKQNRDIDVLPIGLRYMKAETLENVNIPIEWKQGTPRLTITFHEDTGRLGRFDPADSDPPLLIGNKLLSQQINVTYPPIIEVIDQSIVNNTLYVDRVLVSDPAWLTIWRDDGTGDPDRVIGFSPLNAGVNKKVGVEIIDGLVTDVLHAQLHIDVDDAGLFNYPGLDQPITIDGEIFAYQFRGNSGNYVIANDQYIQQEDGQPQVIIDTVVSDVDTFIVIRIDDAEETIGNVIGYQAVQAGVNRHIVVDIDSDQRTPILHATLHIDLDTIGQFEYPDGQDVELTRDGSWIAAPFTAIP